MPDNKPSYEELYGLYKSFVQDEQGFNSKIRDGAIDWYRDIVGIESHFERGILGSAAKSEPLAIKRVLMLNAFEHIAAMDRAYAMRGLDYANYFARRDISLEDDSKTMDRALNFFYRTVTQRV